MDEGGGRGVRRGLWRLQDIMYAPYYFPIVLLLHLMRKVFIHCVYHTQGGFHEPQNPAKVIDVLPMHKGNAIPIALPPSIL